MLRMFSDGYECVIPSYTRCILTGQNPLKMDECPMWKCEEKDQCDGDCEYYTEVCATEMSYLERFTKNLTLNSGKDGEQDGYKSL